MRYFKMTLKYLFRNFIFIFFFAVIPSYFYAKSCNLENLTAVVLSVMQGRFNLDFFQLFSFFSLFDISRWYFALIAFALTVIFMAMLLSLMDKHMRVGTRSFKDLFQRMDYNIGSTLYILSLAFICYELWALVSAGFISLVVMVITNGIARCIICLLFTIVIMVALCYIISKFLLWLPCRHITGYGFLDSLSYSSQLNANKKGGLFLSVLVPYFLCVILQCVVIVLSIYFELGRLPFLFIELIYLFVFLYFNVLMYVAFFDANGEERMDLKRKGFFN